MYFLNWLILNLLHYLYENLDTLIPNPNQNLDTSNQKIITQELRDNVSKSTIV